MNVVLGRPRNTCGLVRKTVESDCSTQYLMAASHIAVKCANLREDIACRPTWWIDTINW